MANYPMRARNGNGAAMQQLGAGLQKLQQYARQNGVELQAAADAYGVGVSCAPCSVPIPGSQIAGSTRQGGAPSTIVSTGTARYIPWSPKLGDCPDNMARVLCWIYKGLCNFNKFGNPGSVKIRTNTITLPDPDFDFQIGPDADQVSLGVFFPRDWVTEAMFHGIGRIKINFQINVLEGDLTPAEIERALFDDLDFRVLQVGTEDPFLVALNIGEAQDAEKSLDNPALGGYFLPAGGEFVPFLFAPEVFAFDFRGQGPGAVGTDSYTVQVGIRTYWVPVC